jgi:Flp pilus assembly protein TadB
MGRLLFVLVVLVAGVAGLGFFLGWFQLSTDRTEQKTNITITVDQDKIQEDEKKAKEKIQEVEKKVKDKVGAVTDKAKEEGSRP